MLKTAYLFLELPPPTHTHTLIADALYGLSNQVNKPAFKWRQWYYRKVNNFNALQSILQWQLSTWPSIGLLVHACCILLCRECSLKTLNCCQIYNMRARWKLLVLAQNRPVTWDKRSLGRDPDRRRCHLHNSVKLSWSQPMNGSDRQHTHMLPPMSMESWAATKKAASYSD